MFWWTSCLWYLRSCSRSGRRCPPPPPRLWWQSWMSAYILSSARTPNTPGTGCPLTHTDTHTHTQSFKHRQHTAEYSSSSPPVLLSSCPPLLPSYLQWASPSWRWLRPSWPWTTVCRWLEQRDPFSTTEEETVTSSLYSACLFFSFLFCHHFVLSFLSFCCVLFGVCCCLPATSSSGCTSSSSPWRASWSSWCWCPASARCVQNTEHRWAEPCTHTHTHTHTHTQILTSVLTPCGSS